MPRTIISESGESGESATERNWPPPLLWRWIGPAPASGILFCIFGLVYGNGVFVAFVDNPAFTRALGVMIFFTSSGISALGILLHHVSTEETYQRSPKYFCLFAAGCLSCQSLMAVALRAQLQPLLYLTAAIVGLGSGCAYLVALAVIQAWFPEKPGTATGVSMLFAASGSIIGTLVFRLAALALGPIDAMFNSGLAVATIALLAAPFVSRTPLNWDGAIKMYKPIEDDRNSILSSPGMFSPYAYRREKRPFKLSLADVLNPSPGQVPIVDPISLSGSKFSPEDPLFIAPKIDDTLSAGEILRTPEFYPFLVAAVSAMTPGTGLIFGFGQMLNILFGMDVDTASSWLFWVSFSAVFGRFLSGFAVDTFDNRIADPSGIIGARRIIRVLLLAQLMALAFIPVWIHIGSAMLFTLSTAVVYFCFSGAAVVAACLARAVFAPANFTLAFSMVCGPVATADMIFSMLVANSSHSKPQSHLPDAHLHTFDNFLSIALGVTAIGVMGSIFISSSRKAYVRAFPDLR